MVAFCGIANTAFLFAIKNQYNGISAYVDWILKVFPKGNWSLGQWSSYLISQRTAHWISIRQKIA